MLEKTNRIRAKLSDAGFSATHGFYNNHYVRRGGDFAVEHFPISVLSVDGIGDIGIDIDSVWVEVKITKDRAMAIDYPLLAKTNKIEVYSADDFLSDFYNEYIDPCEVAGKIGSSDESMICVLFYFNAGCNEDELLEVVSGFCGSPVLNSEF